RHGGFVIERNSNYPRERHYYIVPDFDVFQIRRIGDLDGFDDAIRAFQIDRFLFSVDCCSRLDQFGALAGDSARRLSWRGGSYPLKQRRGWNRLSGLLLTNRYNFIKSCDKWFARFCRRQTVWITDVKRDLLAARPHECNELICAIN